MAKRPRIETEGRSVPEWIGKTDDTRPPPHVRARIFDRHDGVCHISSVKILPGDEWHLDHIKRLADGGANCESNMAPALAKPHREKTSEETRRGRKADRTRRNHIGAKDPPKNPIKSAPFDPAPPQNKASKSSAKIDALRSLGPPAISRQYRQG